MLPCDDPNTRYVQFSTVKALRRVQPVMLETITTMLAGCPS